MNREDVMRMAREAGVYSGANEMVFASSLDRFAALVAAAEREACARKQANGTVRLTPTPSAKEDSNRFVSDNTNG